MSFQAAARELSLTPSAVSHQIKGLERHLGRPLFVRRNRQLSLTPAGRNYYASVRDALQKIMEGSRALRESPRNDVLTIRCGGSFAEIWLMPRLPVFLAEHPNIDLVLETKSQLGDFTEADLEIRYGSTSGANLHVEALREDTIIPMCSPLLLRGAHELRDVEDLSNHTLIESKFSEVTWPMWLSSQNAAIRNVRQLLFDTTALALQAAVYGLGVVLESDFLAKEELASGRLVVPSKLRDMGVRRPLRFMVIPTAKLKLHTVQAFRHWLTREMQQAE
jgi:LysR family glycine cleavage system transcriptional activator